MSLKIYNSLTKKKEEFKPIDPEKVIIYNCGPTVHGRFHLGNARTFAFMDIVVKYLRRFHGYNVHFSQNITDIDDRIISKSKETGISYEDITEDNTDQYFQDLDLLRIQFPNYSPQASSHNKVEAAKKIIKDLINKGYAYKSHNNGDIFFSVKKDKNYGRLSNHKHENVKPGARVEINPFKDDPRDFALWKRTSEDEPSWSSSMGEGKPGWHTECAAMASTLTDETTIDIHSGGHDLKFPHHENEMSIVEAHTGKPLANYWMHVAFVNNKGKKMNDRLDNVVDMGEAFETFDVPVIRYFLLSGHYRHPVDYSLKTMTQMESSLNKIYKTMEIARHFLSDKWRYDWGELLKNKFKNIEEDIRSNPKIEKYFDSFKKHMDNDFNIPACFALIHKVSREMHSEFRKKDPNYEDLQDMYFFIRIMLDFFELENYENHNLSNTNTHEMCDFLIECRNKAKDERAFETADFIKDGLEKMGIATEDYPTKTIWRERK